jgi:hypothetical protein
LFDVGNSLSFIKYLIKPVGSIDYIPILNFVIELICGETDFIRTSVLDEMLEDVTIDKIKYINNKYVCEKNKQKFIFKTIQEDYIILNVCDIIQNLVYFTVKHI